LARQIGLIPSHKKITFSSNANSVAGQVVRLGNKVRAVPTYHGIQFHAYVTGDRFALGGRVPDRLGGVSRLGGISRRQAGGPGGGPTLMGEEGPELVDLPPGAYVRPEATTRARAMAGGGGRAVEQLELSFGRGPSGGGIDHLFWSWLQNMVRIKGGTGPDSVQRALGQRR
jgi:hypothetical protein